MLCIFCLEEKKPGYEHIFQYAIGGRLTTDRVCDRCNGDLGGRVDPALTEHLLIVLRRSQLKLAGHSGAVPDGVMALLGKSVLADDETQKIHLMKNPKTGQLEPRPIYNAKEIAQEDGSVLKTIRVDANTSAAEVQKILRREYKRAGRPFDGAEIDRHVAEALQNPQSVEHPSVIVRPTMDIIKYRLPLLKIIYELAFRWLGEAYRDDPIAEKLRAIILGKTTLDTTPLEGSIQFGTDIAPLAFWRADKDSHVAYSQIVRGKLAIALKIFDVFSAIIFVSDNAGLYVRDQLDPEGIRFVHIDPVNLKHRETSFSEEISRLTTPVGRVAAR